MINNILKCTNPTHQQRDVNNSAFFIFAQESLDKLILEWPTLDWI